MNNERYPEKIANFEAWLRERMIEIETGKNERDIAAAVEMIRPYAEKRWCYPHRLETAETAARKSLARLASKRMTVGTRHDQ